MPEAFEEGFKRCGKEAGVLGLQHKIIVVRTQRFHLGRGLLGTITL
jgi:hypothetical protein